MRTWLAAAIVAAAWSDAAAQTVSLDIGPRGVTLIARGTTLQQILEEWSRVGNVEVMVRGEGFSKAPVTLLLRDLTEREALDILLREVGGYLLVARQNPADGRSAFQRILVVPARGEATLSRETPNTAAARAPRVRSPFGAGDGGIDPVSTPSFTSSIPARSAPPADTAEPLDEVLDVLGTASAPGAANGPTDAQESAATPRPTGAGGAGTEAPTVAGPPPPTPLLPPTPGTRSGNPFGAAGADRPGVLTPAGGPPPGVVYPPVTNPNMERQPFTPGAAPATTTP